MVSVNSVILAGNLTRDPEIRYTPQGTAVGKLGLAVSQKFKTKDGDQKEEVCFVDIEVWARQAETCGEFLKKGSSVLVEGRLKLDTWSDKETGQKRSKHKIRARRVHFLTRSQGQGSSPEREAAPSPAPSFQDDFPPPPPPAPAGGEGDEIPF